MTPSAWIRSRRQDLIWIHGSVLLGVALLVALRVLPARLPDGGIAQPALLLLLAWGVLFDGTHVMGTYARTRGVARSLPRHRWLWFAVGPTVAVIARALGEPRLFATFLLAAVLWAYHHLVRQHWGFVALYRRRRPDATPRWLDEVTLWAGCLIPFLRFATTPAYARSGLPVVLPQTLWSAARTGLDVAAVLAAVGLVVLHARSGTHRHLGPRHLLMGIVIAFHACVFAALSDVVAIMATLTIFHNVQYHRIVWQHEAGEGRRPLGGLGRYAAAGVALGIVWYVPRLLGVTWAGPGVWRDVLLGLGWGVAFHHYDLDARIWRFRRAPALERALAAGAT